MHIVCCLNAHKGRHAHQGHHPGPAGLLSPLTPLHVLMMPCTQVVSHKYFEYAMMALIIGSSICLTMDTVNVDRCA